MKRLEKPLQSNLSVSWCASDDLLGALTFLNHCNIQISQQCKLQRHVGTAIQALGFRLDRANPDQGTQRRGLICPARILARVPDCLCIQNSMEATWLATQPLYSATATKSKMDISMFFKKVIWANLGQMRKRAHHRELQLSNYHVCNYQLKTLFGKLRFWGVIESQATRFFAEDIFIPLCIHFWCVSDVALHWKKCLTTIKLTKKMINVSNRSVSCRK